MPPPAKVGTCNSNALVRTSDSASCLSSEYKDDSQIISRSSSVIVRRLPSVRPGKGKAAMYIAGIPEGSAKPSSSSVSSNASGPAWHKGAMSRRFNVKEESTSIAKPLVVRFRCSYDALQSD
jgi:hypothetical protein